MRIGFVTAALAMTLACEQAHECQPGSVEECPGCLVRSCAANGVWSACMHHGWLCDGGPQPDAGVATRDAYLVPTDAASAPDVLSDDSGLRADAGSACANIDALDRHCATDADCVSAIHAADCCGTHAAIGLAAGEADAYAVLAPICDASYPACGCAAGPTTTDSGEIVSSPSDVHVACVTRGPSAVCLTYVTMRPPMGR